MAGDKKHNRQLHKREERITAQAKPKGDNVIARRHRGNPAWKKGMAAPAGAGRPRGSRNKVTQQRFEEMCDLVLGAAACYGYDGTGTGGAEGYVTMLAQCFPLQFMSIMLARLVPKVVETADLSVRADVNTNYQTVEEARKELGELAASLDVLFDRDDPPLLVQQDEEDKSS